MLFPQTRRSSPQSTSEGSLMCDSTVPMCSSNLVCSSDNALGLECHEVQGVKGLRGLGFKALGCQDFRCRTGFRNAMRILEFRAWKPETLTPKPQTPTPENPETFEAFPAAGPFCPEIRARARSRQSRSQSEPGATGEGGLETWRSRSPTFAASGFRV